MRVEERPAPQILGVAIGEAERVLCLNRRERDLLLRAADLIDKMRVTVETLTGDQDASSEGVWCDLALGAHQMRETAEAGEEAF